MLNPATLLEQDDFDAAYQVLGGKLFKQPDLTITAIDPVTHEDKPYLYRWHVTPRGQGDTICPNDYLHIQVSSDPERPLHDHPWDNMSVIYSRFGYQELMQKNPPFDYTYCERRVQGQVIFRSARNAHRLVLPDGVPYVMTRFFTGPKVRTWGFWIEDKWFPYYDCVTDVGGGRSVFKYPPGTARAGEEA